MIALVLSEKDRYVVRVFSYLYDSLYNPSEVYVLFFTAAEAAFIFAVSIVR